MVCTKCKGENVTITTEQVAGRTKTRKAGILWRIGRLCMIICTMGLWLIIGKRKETGKTKFKSQTVAICQGCGHKWKV